MINIDKLKLLREKRGLSQSELARRAGITQAHVAKIESGKVDPRYSTVVKIFEELMKEEKETCEKYMTKKVYSVHPNDFVSSAVKMMTSKNISQIPVIQGNKLVGLVSEKDFLKELDISKVRIKEIMEDVPPQLSKNANIDVAKDLLREYPVVIVVDRGHAVGIITRANFLKK